MQGRYEIAGLLDRMPRGEGWGHQVLGSEEDLLSLMQRHRIDGYIIAIGDNWKRARVAHDVGARVPELSLVSAVHPSAQVSRHASIGEGSVVMPGVVVNAGARIGRGCLLNTSASFDHEGVMEAFSSLAPHAAVGGQVHVGEYAAIGLGANVIHGVRIGAHAVVGAGAVVVADVPERVVAFGNPARVVRSRKEGEPYL
jgi:sugar O-acyltransferase (sialic acid O-acetyltransferase NeuD family)